jgi:hypothetical protein
MKTISKYSATAPSAPPPTPVPRGQTTEDRSPVSILEKAIAAGADLEKLSGMLDLQERWERNEARKAYHAAMAAFKSSPPEIKKDRHVSFTTQKGTTEYDHATLYNVANAINSALSAHGLTASWSTSQSDGLVEVTCTITHILGHSESTSLKASIDTSGGKNNIQALGSTVTYLQRYTILSLTGLATKDQDDDGASVENPRITPEQVAEIESMMAKVAADEKKFLTYLGVSGLCELDAAGYKRALAALRARKAKR